jgi:Fanconi-associated nuclease 1
LQDLVRSMGLRLVAYLCERLAKNFRYFRSGFPDLVVWDGQDCLFAEVKGPGDSLSSKQSLWLDYLVFIGAKAEVCRVKCKRTTSDKIHIYSITYFC